MRNGMSTQDWVKWIASKSLVGKPVKNEFYALVEVRVKTNDGIVHRTHVVGEAESRIEAKEKAQDFIRDNGFGREAHIVGVHRCAI